MGDDEATKGSTSRRAVLLSAGAVGVSVVLAGCGGDSGDSGDTDAGDATTAPAATSGPASAPTTGAATEGFAKTSDIPVGGGKVFADQHVVVTQPAAGSFKGFTSTCTHMQCQVESISNGSINCPCHGSRFSVADGSVQSGPATRALPAKEITVKGDQILLG
jgi:Rieske Fe-S protein